jgi:molecular chaperone GrpE
MADENGPDIQVIDRRWWARADAGEGDAAVTTFDKPSYVRELEERMAAKDEELRATLTRYREASTEFEQARVRMRRDVAKDVERGTRAILAELLDVVDNLDRAIDAGRASAPGTALLQGVEMVRAQFLAKLDGLGVQTIDAAGRAFVPVTDPEQDGLVVGVIRQGYTIGGEVLRPAVVAVAALTNQGAPS